MTIKSKYVPRKYIAKDFGNRLKEIRSYHGMLQHELARRTGLKVSAISHFETGRRLPSFQNIRKLIVALNVSPEVLLYVSYDRIQYE